jgi:hypothetical protein
VADYNRHDLLPWWFLFLIGALNLICIGSRIVCLAAKLNDVFIRIPCIIKQKDSQNEPNSTVFKRRVNCANIK